MRFSIRHTSVIRFVGLPVTILAAGFFLCVCPQAVLSSDETILPDSWIYPALRSFELAGYVELGTTTPFSRREVELYVERILYAARTDGRGLTRRKQFLLERLEAEFIGKMNLPAEREDRPLLLYQERDDYITLDVPVGFTAGKQFDDDDGAVWGLARPELLLGLGERVTVAAVYRWRLGPERETNMSGLKPSPRERSWRGLVSEFEKSVLSVSGDSWRLSAGRDYLHWGSGRREGLLLSETAHSIDHIAATVSIGRFSLHAVHALLDPGFPRRFSGHRLTVRLPGGIFLGIGETVVYTGRDVEFSYLLPFSIFYANQYNETEDDNILWGLDLKVPVTRGLILYGELLIDDFQYESDPPAPNRLGFNITAEAMVTVGGTDIELLAGYTFIDIYTYAHKDSLLTRYVTGTGDPSVDFLIGSMLGPDADRWNARIAAPVHHRLEAVFEAGFARRGDGNDLREWDRVIDPDPAFPSGEVERETLLSLFGKFDLGTGSYVRAGGGWRHIDGGAEDLDEKDWFLYLETILDF